MKTLLKVVVTTALLTWLVKSGKLDIKSTKVLLDDPELFVGNIVLWVVATVFLTAVRWRMILASIGVEETLRKIVRLNLVGLFFNVAMPGAVGGDFVKAFLVYKENKSASKTRVFSTIIVDRIVGLSALIFIGFATSLYLFFSGKALNGIELMLGFTGSIFLGFLIGVGVIFKLPERIFDAVHVFFDKKIVGFKMVQHLIDVLRQYRSSPQMMIKIFFVSLLIQGMAFLFFGLVITKLLPEAPLSILANVPIAILVTALPISLGGLGVGHMAFEKAFLLSGVSHGSNVYNLYFVGQFVLNLLGSIPYVLYFRKTKIPTTDSEEL